MALEAKVQLVWQDPLDLVERRERVVSQESVVSPGPRATRVTAASLELQVCWASPVQWAVVERKAEMARKGPKESVESLDLQG